MDWKREAESKLRNYTAQKNSIRRTQDEVKRLQMTLTSIRSATADGMPVAGGTNQREDALISNIACQVELGRARAIAELGVQSIEGALADLDDEERLILDRFYIHRQKGHVERLCEELHLDGASTVYWRRDKALKHFAVALYGVTET